MAIVWTSAGPGFRLSRYKTSALAFPSKKCALQKCEGWKQHDLELSDLASFHPCLAFSLLPEITAGIPLFRDPISARC